MAEVPMKNAPELWGLSIATGLAVVAAGSSYVAMGLSSAGAIMVASIVFVVAALILALPREPSLPVEPGTAGRMAQPPAAPSSERAVMPAAASAPSVSVVAAAVPAPAVAALPATRPEGLTAPRDGRADDLTLIKGIGPKLATLCHSLGYYHFDQIASWTAAEVAWVDDNLEGFKGRVTRDDWVAQARALAAGGSTEIPQRAADTGGY